MILELLTNPLSFFAWFGALLVAISVHEFAHAFTAFKLGDPTAKYEERLTLNPLAHLDPIGTLCILFAGFGWGKPVPINPFNFQNPRKDLALTALAGPFANFLLSLLLSLFLKLPLGGVGLYLELFLAPIIILNLNLGLFNLLPLYPLDGGNIISGFLPKNLLTQWEELQTYGLYILIFSLLPLFNGRSIIDFFLSPVIHLLLRLLL